jgi:CIC family chloride channel protein
MRRSLIADTVLLGVVGALSAQAFTRLLRLAQGLFLGVLAGYRPPGIPTEGGSLEQVVGPHGLWLIPLVAALGGLISGLLVYLLAPEAEGDGTDAVIKAFHHAGGLIRARIAPLKTVASAITIGSGGAAGREGPTSLISAAVGSLYATLTHRSEKERRLLVVVGMAAGLAAIFRSPIGTAIFAIEVLYSEMEFDAPALLHTMLGAVTAYAVNGLFVGWGPLFLVSTKNVFPGLLEQGWYVVLGVAAGVVATLLPLVFYGIRDTFAAIPIPRVFKPALGGLLVGLIALALPQVLAGGYGWIQQAIDGNLATLLLFALVFAKILALSLTVSSGGSGGIFAPTFFVGAMLGGAFAGILHLPPAPFVVVGMAAVFGGAGRVPIAALLMVTEMTGGYQLLVPAALAVMLSYLVQTRLSSLVKYHSLYEAQLPRPIDSPAHHEEHIQAALALLGRHPVVKAGRIAHLDLLGLLESTIPVDLPNRAQLSLETLDHASPLVGQPITSTCIAEGRTDVELVAVLRDGDLLLPHAGGKLKAGDRLFIVASAEAREALRQHLAPEAPRDQSAQEVH